MSLAIVLVEPEIAGNTGNIIRLCANVGAELHLVEPLGFSLDEAKLRRAGLDYHDLTNMCVHSSVENVWAALPDRPQWLALTSRGCARYDAVRYEPDSVLVFGAERAGLSSDVLARFSAEQQLYLPMRKNNRSLNLANAVAVVAYEAWRQLGFNDSAIGASMSET